MSIFKLVESCPKGEVISDLIVCYAHGNFEIDNFKSSFWEHFAKCEICSRILDQTIKTFQEARYHEDYVEHSKRLLDLKRKIERY